MSGWTKKRFWKETTTLAVGDGYSVRLDGKPVRTPAKSELIVPTQKMAEAIAAEWAAQEGVINPLSMPVTRSANAAIDKVAVQKAEVVALIAAYGETDLLCYRASSPEALIARQAAAWDPMLDWAQAQLGVRLHVTQGVVPIAQPAKSLAIMTEKLAAFSAFQLTAVHDLVSLSGSLILGLAATTDSAGAQALWALSRIDESWQEERWGADEEAQAYAEGKRIGFMHAFRFFRMCGDLCN